METVSLELFMWVVGALCAAIVPWMSCLSWNAYQTNLRIARMETVLLAISKKAAMLLHDTDDKFKLDKLLDKYALTHDLKDDEWEFVFEKCKKISESKEVPTLEQLLSFVAWVGHLAFHKKTRYRKELDALLKGIKPQ